MLEIPFRDAQERGCWINWKIESRNLKGSKNEGMIMMEVKEQENDLICATYSSTPMIDSDKIIHNLQVIHKNVHDIQVIHSTPMHNHNLNIIHNSTHSTPKQKVIYEWLWWQKIRYATCSLRGIENRDLSMKAGGQEHDSKLTVNDDSDVDLWLTKVDGITLSVMALSCTFIVEKIPPSYWIPTRVGETAPEA